MICINCSSETKVTNSRPQKKSPGVWRRRSCVACGAIFTTMELVSDTGYSFRVAQSTSTPGHAKPVDFSLPRLMLSIAECLGHRPSDGRGDDAYWLTHTIAQDIQATGNNIVTQTALVELTYQTLNRFDPAAGVSYGTRHGIVGQISQRPRRGRPRLTRR
ncbi:MAG TPA: hypothetical protein VF597_01035 [Candidatus Saccharimonadales bacterium]|jgi:transcriptional regulator NrdR family protein